MCDLCNDPEKKKRYEEALRRGLEEGYLKVQVTNREGVPPETLWCKPVSDRLFTVENIPFFNTKCSLGDTIEVTPPEDPRSIVFDFDKVVERVNETLFFVYDIDGMTDDEIKHRYRIFSSACMEHGMAAGVITVGFVNIAVPYGTKDEKRPVIEDIAETAGLTMVEVSEEEQAELFGFPTG